MLKKLMTASIVVTFIVALCSLSYQLGKSNARVQIVTKQVEVVKYVEKKKAAIYSKPNADRADLLKLMRAGLL